MFGNKIKIIVTFFVLLISAQVFAFNDDDRRKLGLTKQEYEICKVLNISKERVQVLLSSGITMQEYSRSPWFSLGVNEEKWVGLRRKGWTNEEIKNSGENGVKVEYENTLVVKSFFLPGYGHYKLKQKPKSFIYSGVAVSSLALYFLHRKEVYGAPQGDYGKGRLLYVGILLGDCLLSSFDVWKLTRYENNPESKRFSFFVNPENKQIDIKVSLLRL